MVNVVYGIHLIIYIIAADKEIGITISCNVEHTLFHQATDMHNSSSRKRYSICTRNIYFRSIESPKSNIWSLWESCFYSTLDSSQVFYTFVSGYKDLAFKNTMFSTYLFEAMIVRSINCIAYKRYSNPLKIFHSNPNYCNLFNCNLVHCNRKKRW